MKVNLVRILKNTALALIISAFYTSTLLAKAYEELPKNIQFKDANATVVEVLSYQCIHCYNHFRAKTMKNLAQKFQNVTFYEWQVAQMGEFGEQMNEILAYAKGLDIRDGFNSVKDDESYTNKILKAYFEATFKYKFNFKDESEFYLIALDIFNQSHKITSADIQNYAKSQNGKQYLDASAQAYEIAKLHGTPSFIINGKYMLNTSKIKSYEEFEKLVGELLNKL